MNLVRALPGFGRIKLIFVLGHCQFFSCSNWTARKTVKKKKWEDLSYKDHVVCLAMLFTAYLANTKL